MVRVVTKVGDVFSVKLDNEVKKYFQLIAFDLTQLNSDVIRAFKKVYPIHATPTLLDIVNDDKFTYVGNLEGENRKAEIGVVMPPLAIVERIKTGKYNFVYPEFE